MTPPTKPKRSEGQWALGDRDPPTPTRNSKKETSAQRPGPDREHLPNRASTASTRRTCAAGCAVGPLHPAQGGLRRHVHRRGERRSHRAPYFAAGPQRRRSTQRRGPAHPREISREFARDTADISDRQNIQYHWIRIEDMPEIWRRLRRSACRPPRRAATARAWSWARQPGESLDEVIDATGDRRDRPPLRQQAPVRQPAAQIQDRDQRPAGCGARDQRCRLRRADHPEHGPGLDLWVGGGLSTNPMLAQRLGAWVPPWTRCPTSGRRRQCLFRDYGYRRLRAKAR